MTHSGFAASDKARLYFETAGNGPNMVMIHAGVADNRQWNAAFDHFQASHSVLRYDMRGFGQSEPVEGAYRPIDDLNAVLAEADVEGPKIMMGCSMGGTLAMDYALTYPEEVSALIMICSGPSGLSLDVEAPEKFAEVDDAESEGNWDLACELETQIWFDGSRKPDEVDPTARALLYDMNRLAYTHGIRELGEREKDISPAGYKRLDEIKCPTLIVTGVLDIPFMSAAAELMCEGIPHAQRVDFENAAHLPNMEHPQKFNACVENFLRSF